MSEMSYSNGWRVSEDEQKILKKNSEKRTDETAETAESDENNQEVSGMSEMS